MHGKQLGASLLVAAALAGCAGVQPRNSENREEAIARLAKERWELLIGSKFAEAYEYISPAARSVLPFEKYKASIKPGVWQGAAVKEVNCEAEDICKALVNVTYTYVMRGAGPIKNESLLTEVWRKDEGRWWYVPNQ